MTSRRTVDKQLSVPVVFSVLLQFCHKTSSQRPKTFAPKCTWSDTTRGGKASNFGVSGGVKTSHFDFWDQLKHGENPTPLRNLTICALFDVFARQLEKRKKRPLLLRGVGWVHPTRNLWSFYELLHHAVDAYLSSCPTRRMV